MKRAPGVLTLNVRGQSELGLTRSCHGCWWPGSLCPQDISHHDIDYIKCVGPSLTWGRILSTCVKSMWWSDIKCKYMFMFHLKTLARTGLTHWGRVMHICVGKLTIIGSDNGLSPERRQAIIWTNAAILLITLLGTNFNEMLIKILTFSFMKMRLKVSSEKWRPFCLGLNMSRPSYLGHIRVEVADIDFLCVLRVLTPRGWQFVEKQR